MTLPTSSRGAVARLLKRRLRNAQQLAAVQFFLLLAPAQLEHARADVQVLVEALAVERAEQTRPHARLGELEIRVAQYKALSGWNPPIATWRLGHLATWRIGRIKAAKATAWKVLRLTAAGATSTGLHRV